jgi:alanine racemase
MNATIISECQRAWVEVNHLALAANVRQLQQHLAPKTQLMAVVKADAYGHGAVQTAQTVLENGASWLAVATVDEGIRLREGKISAPILVLGAVHSAEEISAIAHYDLQPTLVNLHQARLFSQVLQASQQTLSVHLIIDTGMSRLGTLWSEVVPFLEGVCALPGLKIKSLYSHLATADEKDLTMMWQQQQRFQSAIAQLQQHHLTLPMLHLANSAATLVDSSLHYDLVRTGLTLYGLYPAPHLQATIPLQPVLEVKARITQVKTVPAGEGVSYGHRFVTTQPTTIAVVGIGYADGVPRRLSNQLKVLINGQYVPQIGAITMDQLMLDVTDLPNVQVGEVVTLIGQDGEQRITADDWAQTLGTISWEILCGFKHRLPRLYLYH